MPAEGSKQALRAELVATNRALNASGVNRGTSGNLSVRCGHAMLITPSAVPAPDLDPEKLPLMPLADENGASEGPLKPSSEWRFHRDLLRVCLNVGVVVHTHSPFATILAIALKPIPQCFT